MKMRMKRIEPLVSVKKNCTRTIADGEKRVEKLDRHCKTDVVGILPIV